MENTLTPFTPQRSLMASDPAAVAAGEAVKARIQAAYSMAIYQPRNLDQARAKILRMCEIPEFAEKVEYSKPIGNTKIKGLSIRFAEIALSLCRNILTEAQLLYEDDEIKRLRISALDLETNTQFSRDVSIKKTVERKSKKGREEDYISERKNSYNETVYLLRATEDEVLTKESAWVSKFIRTEGLRLVPADIKEEATAKARETLAKRDAQDPAAAKKRILDAFSGLNIWPADLEKYLGHKTDNLSQPEIADLRKVYAAIDSGEATWADYVAPKEKYPAPSASDKKKDQPKTSQTPSGSSVGHEPGGQTDFEVESTDHTPAAFADIIKQQTGKDYQYVPSTDGVANDLLSAYIETTAGNNDMPIAELLAMVSDPGVFPGFWTGFENGTWKQHCDLKLPGDSPAPPPPADKKPETAGGSESVPPPPPPAASRKAESAPPLGTPAPEGKNVFEIIDWKSNGLKKKGLAGYWESYKRYWPSANAAAKTAFKEKWYRVFTEDGVLTKTFPGDDTPDQQETPPPQVQTGSPGPDAAHAPSAEKQSGIDYKAELQKAHDSDIENLVQACDDVGYGPHPVIPMGINACKNLYEAYLKVKAVSSIG